MTLLETKELLKQAITNHLTIQIIYDQDTQERTLNPYHYGMFGQQEQLHAFQTAGPSKSGSEWKNMVLSNIKKVTVTNLKFSPPDVDRNGYVYNPSGSNYKSIEFQITLPPIPPGFRRK